MGNNNNSSEFEWLHIWCWSQLTSCPVCRVQGAHINNDCCSNLKSSKHRWPSKEDLTKKCAESLWIKLFILFPRVVCYYGTPVKSKQDAVLAAPGSYCRAECRVVYGCGGWGEGWLHNYQWPLPTDNLNSGGAITNENKEAELSVSTVPGLCHVASWPDTTPTPVLNIGLLPSTSCFLVIYFLLGIGSHLISWQGYFVVEK